VAARFTPDARIHRTASREPLVARIAVTLTLEREPYVDAVAAIAQRTGFQRPIAASDALAHALQSSAFTAPRQTLGERARPVLDHELEVLLAVGHGDHRVAFAGVLDDVRDRLLHDAVRAHVDAVGQRSNRPFDSKLQADTQASGLTDQGRELGKAGAPVYPDFHASGRENREQLTDLPEGGATQFLHRGDRLGSPSRISIHHAASAGRLKGHDADRTGDVVVESSGQLNSLWIDFVVVARTIADDPKSP
jgi:hypothetical protein